MGVALHLIGLGCARNDVDSEELAGRFFQAGYDLVDDPSEAEVVVVNTCGFIEAAKQESIDEILAAASLKDEGKAKAVVAVGCLAQRYGSQLADLLPEADAVIGFDGYESVASTVTSLLAGDRVAAHEPKDRRLLLPLSPVSRHNSPRTPWLPVRHRLANAPSAPLKIASGCDRRCAFCAIPSFRGAFVSRPIHEIVEEARWLGEQGAKELFLVSENTTSYGKDLGAPHALERLLGELSAVDGIDWLRLSYLQPAEVKTTLIEAISSTPKVVPYFDLPFQHASRSLLRRMRRFGDAESFLALIDQIRRFSPEAGIRSNVIVGFPGETDHDVQALRDFLGMARLDAIGVFAYSDEEGTLAEKLDAHVDPDVIAERASDVSELADTLTALRAQERVGEQVSVLVEGREDGLAMGRSAQQGPEDARSYLRVSSIGSRDAVIPVGSVVKGVVASTQGTDWDVELISA